MTCVPLILLFLLETPWFQPRILSLTTERIGREDFDVLTVAAVKDRVKYYIDRQTSLVRRVGPIGDAGNAVLFPWDLLDYTEQNGIMLPSRMNSRNYRTYDLEFDFNVDYDPAIFMRRPASPEPMGRGDRRADSNRAERRPNR